MVRLEKDGFEILCNPDQLELMLEAGWERTKSEPVQKRQEASPPVTRGRGRRKSTPTVEEFDDEEIPDYDGDDS